MELCGLLLLMRQLLVSPVHTLSGSLFIPDLAFCLAVLVIGFHRTTGVFSSAQHWTLERCDVAQCSTGEQRN